MAAWMVLTQIGTKLVFILLIALSVWSVAIMLDRYRAFKGLGAKFKLWEKTTDESIKANVNPVRVLIESRDWQGLRAWADRQTGSDNKLLAGTIAAILRAGPGDSQIDQVTKIDRAVKSFLTSERAELEKGFTVLATLGSNAPFVGLFGTVLGIIQAFGMLSSQSGSGSGAVMSGIAEALIATAVGLFVAIPAVVGYNVFTRQLKLFVQECESLKDLYISRLEVKSGG